MLYMGVPACVYRSLLPALPAACLRGCLLNRLRYSGTYRQQVLQTLPGPAQVPLYTSPAWEEQEDGGIPGWEQVISRWVHFISWSADLYWEVLFVFYILLLGAIDGNIGGRSAGCHGTDSMDFYMPAYI